MPPKDQAHGNGAALVGRQTQIECLSAVVEGLADGRGVVLEVAGEPGIGKTALLGLLAERAGVAGARVARAHAARGATRPGQIITEVVDALEAPDSSIAREPDAGVRSVLGRWAARRGGVLVLDNVHLCDDQSARLIAQLVRTPPPGPFVLALAHRPRQTGPVLREALEHGAETGSVVRLTPSPWTSGRYPPCSAMRGPPPTPSPRTPSPATRTPSGAPRRHPWSTAPTPSSCTLLPAATRGCCASCSRRAGTRTSGR